MIFSISQTPSKRTLCIQTLSQALSQVILVEDVEDRKCVEAVLAKQNQTWEQAMQTT